MLFLPFSGNENDKSELGKTRFPFNVNWFGTVPKMLNGCRVDRVRVKGSEVSLFPPFGGP